MAPTPSSKPNQSQGTPSSKPFTSQGTPSKTHQAKQRLHLVATPKTPHPSSNPISAANRENPPAEHPVEVIGRIRNYPDRNNKPVSALHVSSDGRSVRVRTDIGYRDFSLDGVSTAEDEDLDGFYKKFVESRINGVKLGDKCTVMMYGPTGSGKSHTMFGCPKQPGIVYRALRDILGEGDEENGGDGHGLGFGSFVQVTVLEIYNEEIYDLMSSNGVGGVGIGWPRGNASKVRLEVMGGKAKNATFISGSEAGKISREVAKLEKRRIIKSTLCNERSSRSHCMIILDVPSVGGRLMLVDMAGSENIDQAGQTGFEAKMQTAKINQGNIALKRVVESIANGDSHVPFRDSKLTMLLQDSFEDDKSKILMILCASPDPKEMHKTISTLEYGAKAKCIVRVSHTSIKDKAGIEDSSSLLLGSRIAAMDQFICKLQMENRLKEKERLEAHNEVIRKETEVAELRAKLREMESKESGTAEEEIKIKVDERTRVLKLELDRKLLECQKIANECVELERRRMEEKILQQQEEIKMLKQRLEEMESQCSRSTSNDKPGDIYSNNFVKRLSEIYANGDQGMEKSMDLDVGDQPAVQVQEVREIKEDFRLLEDTKANLDLTSCSWAEEEGADIVGLKFPEKVYLSTVFEADEEGEQGEDVEVEKEVVEVKEIPNTSSFITSPNFECVPNSGGADLGEADYDRYGLNNNNIASEAKGEPENAKDSSSFRRTRIQNIFMLCGNHRELAHHVKTPTKKKHATAVNMGSSPVFLGDEHLKELQTSPLQDFTSFILSNESNRVNSENNRISSYLEPALPPTLEDEHNLGDTLLCKTRPSYETPQESKENVKPGDENMDPLIEVYVKWEATKEHGGKLISKLKVLPSSSLADIRKLIETHLAEENNKQAFTFLMLGDPTGAPLAKEKEVVTLVSKLPICNNQPGVVHLASLRSTKKTTAQPHNNNLPFSSMENKLHIKQDESLLSQKGQSMSSIPFMTGLQV